MRAVIYFLMRDPKAMKRLQTEVDEATAHGQLSNPVHYAQAIKLPYLCACIKEAMRFHPSVGLTLPRLIPASGAHISGHMIPGGYRIGVNAAVVQYDKSIFGADADSYNPSRWLGDTKKMDRHMLLWGGGSRTCLGKHISLTEIHKLIPQFLREFALEFEEPGKEWKTSNMWFNKQTGLSVRLTRRAK